MCGGEICGGEKEREKKIGELRKENEQKEEKWE